MILEGLRRYIETDQLSSLLVYIDQSEYSLFFFNWEVRKKFCKMESTINAWELKVST